MGKQPDPNDLRRQLRAEKYKDVFIKNDHCTPTGDLVGFLGPEDGPEAEVEAFGGGVVGFLGPEDGPEAEVEAFGGRVVGFLGPEEVGELAGAALVDGDGAVLGEADGEEAEDLGDDAGAEDVDLALFEEAGPLAGDDDGDLDLADGDGALAFAATPEIMATKMRVRTISRFSVRYKAEARGVLVWKKVKEKKSKGLRFLVLADWDDGAAAAAAQHFETFFQKRAVVSRASSTIIIMDAH
ncbi:unnamed protein product [Prunus armeniaca]|uniref:Uncharacterized protein n=1 Tax=Prunus armeniaca TaxID=36596 RepID=A0A6J5UJI0_PRUAR|nr:unnamed protein product [Prunus armeniaca]